jgi:hypothetical protein
VKLLVDTSVWSLALRRRKRDLNPSERRLNYLLTELIHRNQILILGVIRQELLSGIEDARTFARLRDYLRDFDEEPFSARDFEAAAQCFNTCRAAGVLGSAIDMLICAVAMRVDAPIFTTDADFPRYAQHLPLRLPTPEQIESEFRQSRPKRP